ncbi:beta-L-arabinofuranosidase domain-containing protein [Dinghuibacter silviterrae]|uniref:Beta-L-arabinofuranosidase (Glycosyl hydrolase family 127) n=1 Tax=Dinghuibacter silviterrae TaxID=1539049 RepID=A0A4R8DP68_9BACT|nr:beta-L-arabinofuranosidase domain-containing protein [Dinghuibacter silviterrae]TDW99214.1 hypothetical protein EDB95_0223 [Dinghuibacter silviterrae]
MRRHSVFFIVMLLGRAAFGQDSAFVQRTPRPEVFTPLPFGAVRPAGWLAAQIRGNLEGFTGHLDSLVPNLVVKDDIYGKDRLTKDVTRKDVGALAGGGDAAEVQYLWWNSETQSNWRDGFIRSAVLTGDSVYLRRAAAYVRRILSTQDKDGYLGVYDPGLRYRFDGENGELWAKTTLLRGLLAWYAYTRNRKVLVAVERAVGDVMVHYPAGRSRPFFSKSPDVGGLSHGLMFTDVLEELYRLTGRRVYLDYVLFLYKDFSEETLHEDAQYAKLVDPGDYLRGHGVHTYEHLRAVAAAAYTSGNPFLMRALDDYLDKVSRELTPSGAPAGDEWIGGRPADATATGYEYCSLEELLDSYADLLGKTGAPVFGDRVERLFFNAAQGARDPHASCIAYLKTDNSYEMTGGLNGDDHDPRQTRYKYSPVHQDVAVCCVPNAGRVAPYYVRQMWMLGPTGPVATLLGPCTVRFAWKGVPVSISEETDYPYGRAMTFVVHAARPVDFTLAVRRPDWATGVSVSGAYIGKNGYIYVRRPGKVRITFTSSGVRVCRDSKGDAYFMNGALVLARPIPATPVVTRRYPLPGFYDYKYKPDSAVRYAYRGGRVSADGVSFWNPATGQPETVRLVPMGETVLRQVTFPSKP